MAEPPTVIDLSKDDTNSHQANLRKLITVDQDFAEDLAIEAVREIEKLWPDLKAERFASQDILDLATALRTGKVLLEFRMLRAFLVLWKHSVSPHDVVSLEDLTDLVEAIYDLSSRQLGPVEKQNSAAALVVSDITYASKTDDVPNRVYTAGYSIRHSHIGYPTELCKIFTGNEEDLSDCSIDFQEGSEEIRTLWPDLEDKLVPKAAALRIMAFDICAARFDLSFRLLRAYVVCWMSGAFNNPSLVAGQRAKEIRNMALALVGPKNMVTHDNGGVTVLREQGEDR
ncbi:hypothetical protein KCU61_g3149, partial [Aureobasidium melanogenum]